jgi:hypothetical protein
MACAATATPLSKRRTATSETMTGPKRIGKNFPSEDCTE